ncbi:MAG: tRNA pseudouridine(13) synthase TruD [Gammaproteobacteria bacterium]|nr:tRNA pseudouridine(13) synthase TruD [Gammaproteobacteria bacterium]
MTPAWDFAHGPVRCQARIRTTPEDFRVDEVLGFAADGAGEHVMLKVEKRGANSAWVAKELAHLAGVPARAVSYAGRKDRHAVAVQHFTVFLGKRTEPDWLEYSHPEFRVLAAARHRRKLRLGALKGNRFSLVLRELSVPASMLQPRLEHIRRQGVPNYFGPQRFGRDGTNIERAAAFFSGQMSIHDRNLRSLLLSTARSLIFNALLSSRVRDATWKQILPGEVCMLDGSHSVFHAEAVDGGLSARAQSGDVHPTGPLWGRGGIRPSGEAGALETRVVHEYAEFARGLEAAGLQASRRALRLCIGDLQWQSTNDRTLRLEFFLPAGAYATAVLRELTDTGIQDAGEADAHED